MIPVRMNERRIIRLTLPRTDIGTRSLILTALSTVLVPHGRIAIVADPDT